MGAGISLLNEAWHRETRRALDLARENATLLEKERAARAEAETSALQLRVAVEAGRMGTWEYTMASGEVRWSAGLEAIHGYPPGGFPGTFEAFRAEIHPEDRDRVLQAIGESAALGRDHHVEYRIVRSDGAVRWVEGRGQLFRDGDGQPERMVGVCLDVTQQAELAIERERAGEAQRQAKHEAERANRMKDQFLATLSHELRTPINAVVGYAELLSLDGLSPDRLAHALESIKRTARAQARLIDSLIDLSRIEAGKLDLQLGPMDLTGVIERAVDVVRPSADAKGVTLEILPLPSPVPILGDAVRIQQVIWNLVSNAVKFTPPGGRAEVRVDLTDSHAAVRVSDTGQGIKAEFLPHVFDRFSQDGGGSVGPHTGLGLGLAIVRELVEAHRGTVLAESAGEAKGSTFTVRLPLPLPLVAHPAGDGDGAMPGERSSHERPRSFPEADASPSL